jgi:hypothetical protein
MILNENQMEIKENTYFLSEVTVLQSNGIRNVANDIYRRYGIDVRKKTRKGNFFNIDFWTDMVTLAFAVKGSLLGIVINLLVSGFIESQETSEEDYKRMVKAMEGAVDKLRRDAANAKNERDKKKFTKGADRIEKQLKSLGNYDFKKKVAMIFRKKKKDNNEE